MASSDTRAFKAVVKSAGGEVTAYFDDVERKLVEIVGRRDPAAAGPGLEILEAGGKRLRPLLVLVCGAVAEADDGQREALIRAAAAVELIHTAGLIHDDVLDDAALRRGKPTVYAKYGRPTAVTTGNLLFALSFEELAKSGDPRQIAALSDATFGLVSGELVQREDSWKIDVTRERYLLRCSLKTARLFEAAARLGAHAGGRSHLAETFRDFGAKIGLAFQMADDVLDVVASADQTGKTRGADLLDGTVNLPLIMATERDPSLRKLDLHAIQTPEQAAEICDRIVATGAPEAVREEARRMIAEAKQSLTDEVSDSDRAVFASIADQTVGRSS